MHKVIKQIIKQSNNVWDSKTMYKAIKQCINQSLK